MIIQKSYQEKSPTLYLVPTPIGNFEDMTFRAIRILKEVDIILAEDTRVTKILLSHFNIETPLKSYHIFNEHEKQEEIINLLKEGKSIALVSDAGQPVISDPGFLISRSVINEGYKVISMPGASAFVCALVASGLPSERFMFYGFLDHKISKKEKELKELEAYPYSICFYESPIRIIDTLKAINKVLGNREVVIARELTKKYEEYIRGNVSEVLDKITELKGEIVLVLKAGTIIKDIENLNNLSIRNHYESYIKKGFDEKEAMKKVAKDRNLKKSDIYKELL